MPYDRLRDEAAAIRARASFYELEARYADPVRAERELAKAERLRGLADQLENSCRAGRKSVPSGADCAFSEQSSDAPKVVEPTKTNET